MRRIALVALLVSAVMPGLIGCGPGKAAVAAQQREQCFANERNIAMAIGAIHADSGLYPDVQDTANKLGAKCPAGGTYTFDQASGVISCSIHGHP